VEIEETRVKVIAKQERALEKSRKQWLDAQDRIPQRMARPVPTGLDSTISFEGGDPLAPRDLLSLKFSGGAGHEVRGGGGVDDGGEAPPAKPPPATKGSADGLDEMKTMMQRDRQERAHRMDALIEVLSERLEDTSGIQSSSQPSDASESSPTPSA
ncbi:unnamed protein product, partial [Prorocentrum cordatum]